MTEEIPAASVGPALRSATLPQKWAQRFGVYPSVESTPHLNPRHLCVTDPMWFVSHRNLKARIANRGALGTPAE